MRNKIISLFLSILMLIGIIGPSIEVVYAEGNNLPINNENISTKPLDEFKTEESGTKLEDNTIKTTGELSRKNEKVNNKDGFLTENLKNMRGAEEATLGNNPTEVYLDSAKGDDNNDGSKDKPVKTFAKAIEKTKDGYTLNVVSLSETNVTVNKKIKLKFLENVTMQGSGTGIDLSEGSHLTVADGKTLTMSGYKTAINVKKDAEINDGNYVLNKNETAFSLADGAKINGTSKDKLEISAKEQTGRGFSYSSDSRFIGCTVYVEGKLGDSEQYSGLYMKDASLTTKDVWYYFDPDKQNDGTLKGGLHLDNSEFYVYKAKGVRGYTNSFGLLGPSEIKNHSTVTADGSRVTVSQKLVVKDSKFIVKNSTDGGLNINYKPGEVIFENSTLETTNMKWTPSYGTGMREGPCYLTFKGNSVVNTDNKDKTVDNGGANRNTNSTYVVTGGSYLVAYDPNNNYNVTTPTNGKENGDEYLSYFTLKDSNINELKPINKNGKEYSYPVANADKELKTIRGYKLDDVVGNVNPGEPTDKNGVKFLGWYYKTASGEEKAFNWDEKLTADTEVYAKWERKSVIYHNGDGKDYISSVSKDAKDIEVLSFDDILKEKADFKVEGKKFVGWTVAPNGSGKVYNSKEKIDFAEGKSQIDLYAKYTDDEYKVSFSANGGTFSDNSIFKKNKDVFTIEKDKNGGDVAVLKKTAKYNDKLFDLLNGLDHNSLKPDKDAKKDCYKVKSADNWLTSATSGEIRFDDHEKDTFFGKRNIKGKNPQITSDTTYYLSWSDDNNGQCKPIENDENNKNIDAEFTENENKGKKSIVLYDDKEFSLTTDFSTDKIKSDVENIKKNFTGKDEDKISLSSLSSNFEIKVVLPNGIEVAKNPNVTVNGLGNLLKIDGVNRGYLTNDVTVNLGLKEGFTNYKALNDAVKTLGTNPSERSVGDNKISVALNGLKLKNYKNIEDKTKFTAKSSINGTIKAVVKSDSGIKNFMNSYKTSQDLSLDLTVYKPIEFTLDGDLLVKGKEDKTLDTTKDAPYAVDEGDSLTFAGELNVKSIKEQITLLKSGQTDTSDITTSDVKSEFVASIEVPEGLEIPKNPKATLTNNNLFEVESTEVNGNKVLVKMTLINKNYTKFDDLYKDVAGTNAVPDKLQVEVPGIKVKENLTSNTLTVKGSVKGSFRGQASKGDSTQVFNFTWGAKQDAVGKDSKQDPSSSDAIQLTLKLPEKLTLNGDILIGDDTEHNALHEVKAGDVLEYTGRLDVSSIKNKIKLLKESYVGDSDTITTENIKSEFVAELTIPEGLEIPAD